MVNSQQITSPRKPELPQGCKPKTLNPHPTPRLSRRKQPRSQIPKLEILNPQPRTLNLKSQALTPKP